MGSMLALYQTNTTEHINIIIFFVPSHGFDNFAMEDITAQTARALRIHCYARYAYYVVFSHILCVCCL